MSTFYIHRLNRIQFLLLNASAVQLKHSQQINNGKIMVFGLISKAICLDFWSDQPEKGSHHL